MFHLVRRGRSRGAPLDSIALGVDVISRTTSGFGDQRDLRKRLHRGSRQSVSHQKDGGAVDSRTTSVPRSNSHRMLGSLLICSNSSCAARAPISCFGARTVVSAGSTSLASGMSSKPTMTADQGPRCPASRAARATPAATRSLNAMIAVKSRSSRSRSSAGGVALFERIAAVCDRAQRQARLLDDRADAGHAQHRGERRRSCHQRDPAMSELDEVLRGDLAGVDIVEADMGEPRAQALALAGFQQRGDWSRAGPFELQRSDRRVEAHDHRGQAHRLGEPRLGHSGGRRHDDPIDSVSQKDALASAQRVPDPRTRSQSTPRSPPPLPVARCPPQPRPSTDPGSSVREARSSE